MVICLEQGAMFCNAYGSADATAAPSLASRKFRFV